MLSWRCQCRVSNQVIYLVNFTELTVLVNWVVGLCSNFFEMKKFYQFTIRVGGDDADLCRVSNRVYLVNFTILAVSVKR